jgi:hypothetical protein
MTLAEVIDPFVVLLVVLGVAAMIECCLKHKSGG